MRNLTNVERMEMLRAAGIDTNKYDLSEVIVLAPKASEVVEDKQIDNKKLFRRWVTAQTFRMLNYPSWSRRGREYGWDAYLRNNYDYHYQFKMMIDELKVLSKLEVKDKEAFAERSNFFTAEVVIDTCNDYIYKLRKYISDNTTTKSTEENTVFESTVKTTKMVCGMKLHDFVDRFINEPKRIIDNMQRAESYAELYTLLKMFEGTMFYLPKKTPKSSVWKNAFKGIGAYETLKNLILFHDVTLKGCVNKAESIDKLTICLDAYRGEYWRFHYMLKETIEINNFDLKKSIIAHK